MAEPLLTPKEVAAKLRVSERRLGRWRVEGGGPVFVRLGHRTVAYAEGSLTDWINGHTCRSTSDVMASA
jgi:predicted DNA-binding transcriptional regulator AlpA